MHFDSEQQSCKIRKQLALYNHVLSRQMLNSSRDKALSLMQPRGVPDNRGNDSVNTQAFEYWKTPQNERPANR